MVINLIEIKRLVDEIIPVIEELSEEHGMDGNIEMSEQLDNELKSFKKAREELDGFMNTDIPEFALQKALKECSLSVSFDDIVHYIDVLKQRKEHEIEVLENDIDKHNRIRDALGFEGGLK
jgi:hypothetical protein